LSAKTAEGKSRWSIFKKLQSRQPAEKTKQISKKPKVKRVTARLDRSNQNNVKANLIDYMEAGFT
jgi:hypothetical protein